MTRRLIPLAIALLCTAGCYHYHLVPSRSKSATEPMSKTAWAYFWGAWMSPQTITPDNCVTGNLHAVTARTNFGYVLLGVATLGLALPMELEWTCAPDQVVRPAGGPSPVPDIE